MPSRAARAVGTRRATCVSWTDGAIIGITNGWDTKQQRLVPDAEQSARPVLRGAPDSNAAAPTRLRLWPHPARTARGAWAGDAAAAIAGGVADRGEGPVP